VQLGPGDASHLRLGQVQQYRAVGVTPVKQESRPGRERGEKLGPAALVVGMGIGFVPELPRQPRGESEPRGQAAGARVRG
jgi:hypothetical protein